MTIKSVKILVENAYGERVTVEYPVVTAEGNSTIDVPVTDFCDATDLGYFPLHLVYYYITFNTVTVGEQYTLGIPGMEMVYGSMPANESLKGDVNGDGEVNIADINAILDVIMKGGFDARSDVNHDNEVNIVDVNAVIDVIIG